MVQINECLADSNNDWEKRVDSVNKQKNTYLFNDILLIICIIIISA